MSSPASSGAPVLATMVHIDVTAATLPGAFMPIVLTVASVMFRAGRL